MHGNFDFKTSAVSSTVSVKFATKQTQQYRVCWVLINALLEVSHFVGFFLIL